MIKAPLPPLLTRALATANAPTNANAPANATAVHLQHIARDMFWTRGYSNVSLREISRQAGVDVALIGRYFGNKEGLFVQTLPLAFQILPDPATMRQFTRDALIDFVIKIFVQDNFEDAPPTPSLVDLIAVNGQDRDVGTRVMAMQHAQIHRPLVAILGSDARAELFWAVIVGCCVTQNAAGPQNSGFSSQNAAQLRHMLLAAARFGDDLQV